MATRWIYDTAGKQVYHQDGKHIYATPTGTCEFCENGGWWYQMESGAACPRWPEASLRQPVWPILSAQQIKKGEIHGLHPLCRAHYGPRPWFSGQGRKRDGSSCAARRLAAGRPERGTYGRAKRMQGGHQRRNRRRDRRATFVAFARRNDILPSDTLSAISACRHLDPIRTLQFAERRER
jgi:hypothetical protein